VAIGAQTGMTADKCKGFEMKLQSLIETTKFSIWKFDSELS